MIKGIGTDIVEIARIDHKLVDRILSVPEIEKYSNFKSESRKSEFLAGRFAVKEAIYKALGHLDFSLSMTDLIILNDQYGCPYLLCDKLKNERIKISISHERLFAIAFCVIENDDL
jgi:holo-[acyl-carrier protein] synthase